MRADHFSVKIAKTAKVAMTSRRDEHEDYRHSLNGHRRVTRETTRQDKTMPVRSKEKGEARMLMRVMIAVMVQQSIVHAEEAR